MPYNINNKPCNQIKSTAALNRKKKILKRVWDRLRCLWCIRRFDILDNLIYTYVCMYVHAFGIIGAPLDSHNSNAGYDQKACTGVRKSNISEQIRYRVRYIYICMGWKVFLIDHQIALIFLCCVVVCCLCCWDLDGGHYGYCSNAFGRPTMLGTYACPHPT